MSIFFIADTHFDDVNILHYENRPFNTVEEMNQVLIENWNQTVRKEDTVYFLGDIGAEQYVKQLNGKKILIKGNHDTKDNNSYRMSGFAEVYDLPVILDGFWILSHEPMYVNENMPYANVFGHIHNNPMYRTVSPHSYCVSVERIGYTPVLFEDVKRAVQGCHDKRYTINYYNTNAKDFADTTISVNFSDTQNRFANKLPVGATILDFGCGSGRDTKYFLDKGFLVEAIDGSVELCKIASEYTGISVKHMYFQELCEVDKYHGIWACSSILHLDKQELLCVMQKMAQALKKDGIIYTSFKYGTFEGERSGRYFTDMTEGSFSELMKDISGVEIEEQWITSDVRPERGEEQWLNLILRKK